jgi:hypothetical protein
MNVSLDFVQVKTMGNLCHLMELVSNCSVYLEEIKDTFQLHTNDEFSYQIHLNAFKSISYHLPMKITFI